MLVNYIKIGKRKDNHCIEGVGTMFELKNVIVEGVLKIDHLTLKEDVISIEGQSGSGKTTILRLLNNLDDPKSGEILFKEEEITSIAPRELRKRVVMLPQNPVMFDGTVRDNLLIGLRFSGEAEVSDETLQEMLKAMSLEKELETKASDLSGGEKQRLAIGRILLLQKAEVYLLDEPSSDLDDHTTDQVLTNFFERAKENGKQTIMVTHDQEVSKRFSDQVINMDQYSQSIHQEGDDK